MGAKVFLYVGLPIIITLVSIIGWKYYDLTSTISKQELTIEKLKNAKLILEVDLATERNNVSVLTNTVSELNADIEKMAIRNQNTIEEFNNFKKKADHEKYNSEQALQLLNSKLWTSEDCKEGLELNRMISNLKYEDL